MPAALGWAIASFGASIGGVTGAFLIMNAGVLASGALLLGGLAFSASQAAKAKRKARDAYNASQVDRFANVVTTVSQRDLVLGRSRKGGTLFFKGSTGPNKSIYVMCIALAGHEIDAVEQIYFNDEPVTLDGSGNVTSAPYSISTTVSGVATCDASGHVTLAGEPIAGTITAHTGIGGREGDLAEHAVSVVGTAATSVPYATINYQYLSISAKANVRTYLGTPDQLADPDLVSLFPTLWTSAHRARGVAYLMCRFYYDETAFPTGLPAVTATIRGAKIYDPRTGLTAWSQNPDLMMRYVYTHPSFGKSTPSAAEDARIVTAANACDASHGYVVDGVTSTVSLYRAALVQPFGATAKEVFDDLAQAMAGAWAYAGGELYVKAGTWTGSVMSLTDDDLAVVVHAGGSRSQSPIGINVHRELQSKFNTVNCQIWDKAQDYKQVALTPLQSSALVTRDGAELVQSVSMPAVFHAPQALHVAGVLMRDARDPLTVTLPFKLRAYPIELFDVVDLTIARYGWSGKLFQVLGREWGANGALQLTLKETSATIYTPDAEFLPQGYAANTALPNAWYVPTIGALTVSSGTAELIKQADGSILSRMRISWPAIDDMSVTNGGSIEIQYRAVTDTGEWQRQQVDGNVTQIVVAGVQDDNSYVIRARARNRLAVGQWSNQVVHLVLGKSEPPPPFDRFLVLVQPDGTRQLHFGYTTAPPVDWLGAQIRYLTGTHAAPDWDAMTVLSDQATHYTASPVEANAPPAGTYTFACKSVDRTGNLSTYLLQTITLPDRRLGSVYAEWDEYEDGWLGTLTSCLVNADGYLEAIDSTTWATAPATWTAWTRWNMSPASPIYYQTPDQDLGTVITGQLSATVDADGTTLVEMATSADGTTWSGWGSTSGIFTSQWVRLRLTVTATGPAPVPLVRAFSWLVDAPLVSEYVNDVDISTLTGSYRIGTGDVRMPITGSYSLIRRSSVVIQHAAGGQWTAVRIDQSTSPSPRWQFRLAGVLADPDYVDFLVEGFAL